MATTMRARAAVLKIHGYTNDGQETTVTLVLEQPCRCGDGKVCNPAWREWESAGRPAGKQPRDYAGGPEQPEELTCPECGGHGLRLSPDGHQLVDFMRRWAG